MFDQLKWTNIVIVPNYSIYKYFTVKTLFISFNFSSNFYFSPFLLGMLVGSVFNILSLMTTSQISTLTNLGCKENQKFSMVVWILEIQQK